MVRDFTFADLPVAAKALGHGKTNHIHSLWAVIGNEHWTSPSSGLKMNLRDDELSDLVAGAEQLGGVHRRPRVHGLDRGAPRGEHADAHHDDDGRHECPHGGPDGPELDPLRTNAPGEPGLPANVGG